MLQQTVIRVLEDAMYNNRCIDPAGLDRLVLASRTARNGSLDALKGQYQRLLLEAPLSYAPLRARSPVPLPPLASSAGPHQQHHEETIRVVHQAPREPARPPSPRPTTKRLAVLQLPPPPPALPLPRDRSRDNTKDGKKPSLGGADFFCRYSLDLQRTSSLPLSRTFDPWPLSRPGGGRKSHCPACRVPVAVDATDMWEIEIPVLVRDKAEERALHHRDLDRVMRKNSRKSHRHHHGDDDDGARDIVAVTTTTTKQRREVIRRFRVPARFVVKCHTPEGDFACVLCCGPQDGWRARGEVVLCDNPESLVDHVAREHRVGDLENEWDILPG